MRTLLEHIDDLDRMVDANASKPDVRNQIAFVQKQVVALETDLQQMTEAYQTVKSQLETAQQQNAALKEAEKQRLDANRNRAVGESHVPETYSDKSL